MNVLYLNDPAEPEERRAKSALDVRRFVGNGSFTPGGAPVDERLRFSLKVLDDLRLDGVVKSNDEPYSFTSNGSRDAAVFNNVIQGPTLVNNGFLLYDPNANPSPSVSGMGAQRHGALPLRTVEV